MYGIFLLLTILFCILGFAYDKLSESAWLGLYIIGQFLVEAFPSLQRLPSWFPGARFKRVAAAWREESLRIRDQLYTSAKEIMASTSVVLDESYVTNVLGRVRAG